MLTIEKTKRNRRGTLAHAVDVLEEAARRAPGLDWKRQAELLAVSRSFDLVKHGPPGEWEAKVRAAIAAAGLDPSDELLGAMLLVYRRAARLEDRIGQLVQAAAHRAIDGRRRRARCPLVQDLADFAAEVEVFRRASEYPLVVMRPRRRPSGSSGSRTRTRSGRTRRVA